MIYHGTLQSPLPLQKSLLYEQNETGADDHTETNLFYPSVLQMLETTTPSILNHNRESWLR